MRKKLFYIAASLFFMLSSDYAHGQLWENTYGKDSTEWLHCIALAPDNGFLLGGYTLSFGNDKQSYLVRIDGQGDTLWTKVFGGPFIDHVQSIVSLKTGGYILAGVSSLSSDRDVMVMRIDDSGNVIWEKSYDLSTQDVANKVILTPEGKIILTGSYLSGSYYDIFLLAYDLNGNFLWKKQYADVYNESAFDVIHTKNNEFIIAGSSNSPSFVNNAFLLKTNANGDSIWSAKYGKFAHEYVYDIESTIDGGYIIGGYSTSFSASPDAYLLKLDANGDSLWMRSYGGTGNDEFERVLQLPDSSYLCFGKTTSFGATSGDLYLVRTDFNGNEIWTKTFGGSGAEYSADMILKPFGKGLIMGGSSSSYSSDQDFYAISSDIFGNLNKLQVSGFIHTSDTSKYHLAGVKLYRHLSGKQKLEKVTEIMTHNTDTGKFVINDIVGGIYHLIAFPDIGRHPQLMPTYHGNVKHWWESEPIVISDTLDSLMIHFLDVPPPPVNGKGKIFGYIKEGNINGKRMGPGDPLKGINVSVLDKNTGSVTHWNISDSTGYFTASSFENGEYEIVSEVPGLIVDTANNSFYITDEDTMYNITFTVDSNMVKVNISDTSGMVGIGINPSGSSNALYIYPNPTNGRVIIRSNSESNGILGIKITDVQGRQITVDSERSDREFVELTGHPAGVYFIEIKTYQGVTRSKIILLD